MNLIFDITRPPVFVIKCINVNIVTNMN